MQNNPSQNQPPGKDYPPRKDYNYSQPSQDHPPDQNSGGYPHKPPTNPPIPAKNQQSSNADTRPPQEQAYSNMANDPIQVKHMANKNQAQPQTQQQQQNPQGPQQVQLQPQQQVQSHPIVQGQSQYQHPPQGPQPIINEQTILALNYLQTHLLGGKNNILENQAHMISDPPVQNNDAPPYQGQAQNDQQYNRMQRDNYYGGDQRGNRGDYRDNAGGNRGYNNNNPRDFHQQRNYNGPNDFDRSRRSTNYSSERASYEKSRSRSNEKRNAFDARPQQYNNYQKDGYKGRNGHYKEHQNREFTPKQKSDCYEDWKCLACGNVNWARRENCNKCGLSKPEDAPVVINPLRDTPQKNMPPQDRNMDNKGYPNEGYNNNNNNNPYYRDDTRRNDYGNMGPRGNQGGRPNYGNAGFKP